MAKTVKKETVKKEPVKKATPKKATPKKAAGAKGSGLTKPMIISEQLQKVIGKKTCSRADTMSLVWKYIKENELQVPTDKRTIAPDTTLAGVTGKTPFGMMQLAGKLSKHLTNIE